MIDYEILDDVAFTPEEFEALMKKVNAGKGVVIFYKGKRRIEGMLTKAKRIERIGDWINIHKLTIARVVE